MGLYIGSQRVCPIVKVKGYDSKGKYLVTVIDYDGTILYQDHLDNGAKVYLPPAPNHEKLTFQGWSCAETISTDSNGSYVTVGEQDVTVGAYYTTVSGMTEIDIELTSITGLTFTCKMTGTKDWGDGTSDSLTSHTYANYGTYTVKTSSANWGSNNSSSGTFGQSSGNINYSVKEVRVGASINTYNYSYVFSYCYGLKTVSLKSVTNTTIGSYFMRNAINLQALVIPFGIKSIGSYGFYYAAQALYPVIPSTVTSFGTYSLMYLQQAVTIPLPQNTSITTLGNSVLSYASMVRTVKIPPKVTSIGTGTFNGCNSFQYIKFPKTVTSIGGSAFTSTRGCIFDFSEHTSIPTLGAGAFNSYYPTTKILVPNSLVNNWKTASNWSAYANIIVGV